jgi:hypothetical protein
MRVRQTRQREVILEAVRSTMDHPTADWVYRQARRRLPRIGLGTVGSARRARPVPSLWRIILNARRPGGRIYPREGSKR